MSVSCSVKLSRQLPMIWATRAMLTGMFLVFAPSSMLPTHWPKKLKHQLYFQLAVDPSSLACSSLQSQTIVFAGASTRAPQISRRITLIT